MGKIIILGSEKGGVAKTTSTYNLAYCLAKEGKKVLAVDFDSQANLSTCFGIEDTGAVAVTIGHLMMNRIEDEEMPDASEYIMSRNGVDFIPSSVMLSVVDAKLRLEMGAERMLAGVLEPLKGRYDYILVDTCPSLGSLTINVAAHLFWLQINLIDCHRINRYNDISIEKEKVPEHLFFCRDKCSGTIYKHGYYIKIRNRIQ